jgi:pimeloyl-ACP methyl ester carboxylesterase
MQRTTSTPRIAYRLEGDAGPPVLLVMGFGMSGVVWRPQVEELRASHRVVWYDHLGVGASEAAPPWPTMASMAKDALRVLDDVGFESAHVVGVSMGGMIAQELALAAPSRVRSLTLVATHAGGVRAALPTVEGLVRFAQANLGAPSERVAALQRLLYTPEFLASVDRAAMTARMKDMVGERAPRATVRGHLGAVLRHRTTARLGGVRAPTLVVRPGRDVLIRPKNSDVLARLIPGARVARFDDAGHGVTFQSAAALNQAIARHVAAAEGQAPSRA